MWLLAWVGLDDQVAKFAEAVREREMNRRKFFLFFIDIFIFTGVFSFISYFISVNTTGTMTLDRAFVHCAVMLACIFSMRIVMGLYVQIWRYANVRDYLNMIIADFLGGILYVIFDRFLFSESHLMIAGAIAIVSSALIVTLSIRFIYQRIRYYHNVRRGSKNDNGVNVAIVGAGALGVALAQELQANPKGRYKPYCFIDSDREKIGSKVGGLHVYAEHDAVATQISAMPVQEVIIAIDSLSPERLNALHKKYQQSGCKVKLYASPLESVDDLDAKPAIRDIRIEDLLRRDVVSLSADGIADFYQDKVVLITGGGGSIGSELARQVAKMSPRQLIILDIYENNANDIQQELARLRGGRLDVRVEIASVRDADKLERIFTRYRPNIVFHAAAHKHVHLMESCLDEAIKNNVFGTYHAVQAAEKAGVDRFILISTDKAVNPTNMMGATKRVCEMIIQSKQSSKTRFAAVRFGNVLGSNGSVIPLFKRQIDEGGPVTITDKRIVRYFMTIPEAAQLLLQTGVMANSGEIFVLDMGKPVKILDLAENMIRLSGLIPYKDVEIKEVGLRPGEKLYEELLMKTEGMRETTNNKIFIEHEAPISPEEIDAKLKELQVALVQPETESLRSLMMRLVPTYHNADEVNGHAKETEGVKR